MRGSGRRCGARRRRPARRCRSRRCWCDLRSAPARERTNERRYDETDDDGEADLPGDRPVARPTPERTTLGRLATRHASAVVCTACRSRNGPSRSSACPLVTPEAPSGEQNDPACTPCCTDDGAVVCGAVEGGWVAG